MGLEQLVPWIQPYARELVRQGQPFGAQLTSVWRSRAEQAALYQAYVSGASRYPAAPPGHSMHERRRAFDIAAPPWLLIELGELWEYWGGRWGGRGGDPIHFEA